MDRIDPSQIQHANKAGMRNHQIDLKYLVGLLERRGLDADALLKKASQFEVAIPTWGLGQGGTRFARFPLPGEPRNIYEKLMDAAVVNDLCRLTPRLSPHIPWDKVATPKDVKKLAHQLGLSFDAINS